MDNRQVIISALRKYEVSNNRKSLGIVIFTICLHLILLTMSAFSYTIHPWLPALFWIPIGILFCRFFVLEHDAGHYSLFTKRSYNRISCAILGFFSTLTSPLWNYVHDTHHGMLGNLSIRNDNPEMWTMTVNEYKSASKGKRRMYRFVRSKFMRLGVTPFLWIIAPRIPFPQLGAKIVLAILIQDLIYGTILYFLILNHLFFAFVVVFLVPLYLFNVTASIFFYLQHQFEDTSWETDKDWDLYNASIHGSSHLVVGKVMGWVSGNVGCHHIHHLNVKIPSYNLYAATEDANQYIDIEPIYLKDMFVHFNSTLWDEDMKKLISFKSFQNTYER
jgi:omega-6 fatty acid desaturase (delta-12 desaturase)